ncbi:MAG: hypothetical protein ACTSSK_12695, partial [Candidatus Heimdallarchaeota archaeon]
MRKSIFLFTILIISVLINPISMVIATNDNSAIIDVTIDSLPIEESTTILPEKASYFNGTWAQLTTTAFTPDGNITEWDTEGILPEIFDGVLIYLAYDATNVYVAATWLDDDVNDLGRYWIKTSEPDIYNSYSGSEDILSIGFSNSTF